MAAKIEHLHVHCTPYSLGITLLRIIQEHEDVAETILLQLRKRGFVFISKRDLLLNAHEIVPEEILEIQSKSKLYNLDMFKIAYTFYKVLMLHLKKHYARFDYSLQKMNDNALNELANDIYKINGFKFNPLKELGIRLRLLPEPAVFQKLYENNLDLNRDSCAPFCTSAVIAYELLDYIRLTVEPLVMKSLHPITDQLGIKAHFFRNTLAWGLTQEQQLSLDWHLGERIGNCPIVQVKQLHPAEERRMEEINLYFEPVFQEKRQFLPRNVSEDLINAFSIPNKIRKEEFTKTSEEYLKERIDKLRVVDFPFKRPTSKSVTLHLDLYREQLEKNDQLTYDMFAMPKAIDKAFSFIHSTDDEDDELTLEENDIIVDLN